MKILSQFFLIATFLISSQSMAKIVVISDLDDTIRQVNVVDMDEVILRVAVERIGANTITKFDKLHMIYEDLSLNQEASFYYVSASYPIIYNARKWLQKNDFPTGKVIQRNKRDEFNSSAFKKRILKEIITENDDPDTQFLFFGDNGEHDPESYNAVVSELNIEDRSIIMIRDVVTDATFKYEDSKELIAGTHYFFTEKTLVTGPLSTLLDETTKSQIDIEETLADVPAYIQDNLDERIEDNVCEKISKWRHPIRKIQCHYNSGQNAKEKIINYLRSR